MCIIVVIPRKKKIPSDEILRRCFESNPDGFGLMYTDNDQVIIQKGIMDIEQMITTAHNVHTEYGSTSHIVLHYRIGTSGKKKSPECTHPFPISNDYRDLYKMQIVCDRAIAHNGIIYQYEQRNSVLSDTMFFCKMLTGLTSIQTIRRALTGHNSSKFAYLYKDGTLLKTGQWFNHKGVFYSNSTFMPEVKTVSRYSCYGQECLENYDKHTDVYTYRNAVQKTDDEKEKEQKFREYIEGYHL